MPDKRLIDAKALDEALREEYLSAVEQSSVLTARGSIIFNAVLDRVRCMVMSAPTIDAVEVVHGRWVHEQRYGDSGGWVWRCSACRREAISPIISALKYCHSCGAKMDAKEG